MKLIVSFLLLSLQLTGLGKHLPQTPITKLQDYILHGPANQHHQDASMAHQALPEPRQTGTEVFAPGATSAVAIDALTGQVLFSKNPDMQRPIASITKLVTAMVIVQSHALNETVTVGAISAYKPEDAKLGLVQGQQFKLGDLLTAALIPSANDAAEALALHDSANLTTFAAKMNRLCAEWGIKDLHFTSVNGLVETNNYATASDLAKLGKIALVNPIIARLTSTASADISDASGRTYHLASTNQLLQDSRFSGIKTGYTLASGESFLGLATIGGHHIITVVLNSPDRFGETAALAGWIERNYTWQ